MMPFDSPWPPVCPPRSRTPPLRSGLFLLWSLMLVGFAVPVSADPPSAAQQAQVTATLGQLPLLFIENRGQLDPQVAYYVQGSTNTLYFTPTGVTFALTGPAEPAAGEVAPPPAAADPPAAGLRKINLATTPRQRWVVKLDFLAANPSVKPQGNRMSLEFTNIIKNLSY